MPVLPIIVCRLSDKEGNMLSPYDPNSLTYTEISKSSYRLELEKYQSGRKDILNYVTFSIEGYVTVFSDGQRISPPLPFCAIKNVSLYAPRGTALHFLTAGFYCNISGILNEENNYYYDKINITVNISTVVSCKADVNIVVPEVDSSLNIINRVCINTKMLYDAVNTQSKTIITYTIVRLSANVSQYIALSDGEKKAFTNNDELLMYGNQGILAPEEVSYYNLFVNGVLQPKSNYKISKGLLEITASDTPPAGQPITVTFITFQCNRSISVFNNEFCAVSDGIKRRFTDADALREYGSYPIPSPNDVSMLNLYVNGMLQPQCNYSVEKGLLELTTSDIPVKGAPITLESLIIKDVHGRLLKAKTYQYIARSDGKRIYTNKDELKEYGSKGISSPNHNSYHNLFVNGMIQPQKNYQVREGCLSLTTEDTPPVGVPITLQFVSIFFEQ